MLRMRVNAKNAMNVRAEPKQDAEIVEVIKTGTEVTVLSVSDGWARIRKGYCLARLLEMVFYDGGAADDAEEPAPSEPEDEQSDGSEQEEAEQADSGELEKMTVSELRDLARLSGIDLRKDMKKADIIAAIIDD